MRIKTGDTVVVLSGQDKGRTGKVTATYPSTGRVMVEGVNIKVKHRKPAGNSRPGGREKAEHPMAASKVAVVRPGGKKPLGSRIGYSIDKDGKKKRVLRQAGNKELK